MTEHESKPAEPGIRDSKSPQPSSPQALPPAWQPLTFRGVAAFSQTRIGRVLLLQSLVALLAAMAVLWCLHSTWFQRALEAIRALPVTGSIENRVLISPRNSPEPLAVDGFLAISINLDQTAGRGSASDVRLEFHRTDYTVCSLLGCLKFDYPERPLPFNQPDLEAWWGAWRWTIFVSVVSAAVAFLFVSWFFLATCYALPAWFIAYFKDRDLSLAGSWKLAAAALLTPALFMAGFIVLYALNAVDLVRLLVLWCLHVPLGWVYLYGALVRLPMTAQAADRKANPFGGPVEKKRDGESKNPFAGVG